MIRPCGPEQAPALAALHAQCFPTDESWGQDSIRMMLELPGGYGLRLPGQGMILCRVAADEAEVLTLGVVPAARRGGVGKALLRAALVQALALGAQAMFLEVEADNMAALALYLGQGFAEVGRRRNYYGTGRDALVLRWQSRD